MNQVTDLNSLRMWKDVVLAGVMKAPQEGEWCVIVASDGESSFSFHMLAFDEKALRKEASNASQMSLPLKCRACLVASKGVGASICVAAGLAAVPVIPAALVGAVGSFLGIGAPVAAAFIGKAVEEFYDRIAKKVCEALGFCDATSTNCGKSLLYVHPCRRFQEGLL